LTPIREEVELNASIVISMVTIPETIWKREIEKEGMIED